MKKIIPLLLTAILAFSLTSCTIKLHIKDELLSYFSWEIEYDDENAGNSSINGTEDSSSQESESVEENSSESSEEVTPGDSSEEDFIVPPSLYEDGTDLATCAPFLSRAPERYGVKSTMFVQNSETHGTSWYALKGVFNNKGAYPYQEYQVWTWASLCLKEHYGNTVNLKDKCLTYDVKTDNCGNYSSFIIMAPNGQRSDEVSFSFTNPAQTYAGITCKALSNGWYRVTINFSQAYGELAILSEASEILIMYSNADCANRNADSIFYMDNMTLETAR